MVFVCLGTVLLFVCLSDGVCVCVYCPVLFVCLSDALLCVFGYCTPVCRFE